MDNLTHSLVGAAMGRAGLARGRALAMPALVIGANLPDVDVLGLPFGLNLGFRRGITHGLLALGLWPFVLAVLLLAWDKWRRRRDPARPVPDPRALLLAATAGVLSHPLLDWFNTYGMRWLSPFSDRWFYGDTWFIIDPWVIGILLGALWMTRAPHGRPPRARPAAVGLLLVAGYAVAMWAGSVGGERLVRRELAGLGFPEPRQVMVAPVPLNALVRDVVVDDGRAYRRTRLVPGKPVALPPGPAIAHGLEGLDLAAVAADPQGGQFLRWSRFPFARVDTLRDRLVVTLDDARYTGPGGRSFARTVVTLPTRP